MAYHPNSDSGHGWEADNCYGCIHNESDCPLQVLMTVMNYDQIPPPESDVAERRRLAFEAKQGDDDRDEKLENAIQDSKKVGYAEAAALTLDTVHPEGKLCRMRVGGSVSMGIEDPDHPIALSGAMIEVHMIELEDLMGRVIPGSQLIGDVVEKVRGWLSGGG